MLFLNVAPAAALYVEDDVLGFYFDTGAESNCLETPRNTVQNQT